MHEGKNEETKHRRARLISTDFLPDKSRKESTGLGGINSHDCVRSDNHVSANAAFIR